PLGPRDDLRRPRHRYLPHPGMADRAPDVPGPQPPHVSDQAIRDPVRRPDPVRVAEMPARPSARLGAAAIRHVLTLRVGTAPSAPTSGLTARLEEHMPRPLPVEGDEIEPHGRDC